MSEKDIKELIIRRLDGDDYDRDQLEAARATADNTAALLAQVCRSLVDQGILTEVGVERMLGECPHW